jgi:hypothetical protein
VTSAVYRREPYRSHAGRDTFNDSDGIFAQSGVLTIRREGDGYLGLLTLDVERV